MVEKSEPASRSKPRPSFATSEPSITIFSSALSPAMAGSASSPISVNVFGDAPVCVYPSMKTVVVITGRLPRLLSTVIVQTPLTSQFGSGVGPAVGIANAILVLPVPQELAAAFASWMAARREHLPFEARQTPSGALKAFASSMSSVVLTMIGDTGHGLAAKLAAMV